MIGTFVFFSGLRKPQSATIREGGDKFGRKPEMWGGGAPARLFSNWERYLDFVPIVQ
jgi:hypothetical protein